MAGNPGVLPDIDEIKSHMGYRVWQFSRGFRGRIGLQSITHSFGGLTGAVILAMVCRLEPTWILAGDDRLDLPSGARCSIRWYPVMRCGGLSSGVGISMDARQLENVWIAGLHSYARWTGVIDDRICRATVAAGLDRSSERR